ncbi:antiterminator Q family protein [Arsenophonus nasoniae]|uniref:Antiterminator Q family protein n=1 Tax=Arsenophonus nasoniae TaxID=638 RepID=A0AA95G970_9GAMM|nr:antiterminator Q family protein [Arsenophonus nasoniae]WGL93787.1 antiterminator Q family protein [Arsenophonus nasoniae]WGL96001.1 antiterminator Q family protein [Arsenophonus nasoniae]
MRDIQQVLERWGAWVADNPNDVAWSHIAAGFKGVIPRKVKSRPQCCEDDAMIISSCVAKLNKNNRDIHDLIFEYYVFGKTFIQLARQYSCSDTHIGKKLQKAEGVIEGMLMMLNIKLEMDKFVQKN